MIVPNKNAFQVIIFYNFYFFFTKDEHTTFFMNVLGRQPTGAPLWVNNFVNNFTLVKIKLLIEFYKSFTNVKFKSILRIKREFLYFCSEFPKIAKTTSIQEFIYDRNQSGYLIK